MANNVNPNNFLNTFALIEDYKNGEEKDLPVVAAPAPAKEAHAVHEFVSRLNQASGLKLASHGIDCLSTYLRKKNQQHYDQILVKVLAATGDFLKKQEELNENTPAKAAVTEPLTDADDEWCQIDDKGSPECDALVKGYQNANQLTRLSIKVVDKLQHEVPGARRKLREILHFVEANNIDPRVKAGLMIVEGFLIALDFLEKKH